MYNMHYTVAPAATGSFNAACPGHAAGHIPRQRQHTVDDRSATSMCRHGLKNVLHLQL